jgi:hypothetical protein
MTSIDDMAAEIMEGLSEYAELADTAMKKAVRKTATAVKNEISANAPVKSGRYKRSWTAKKTKENSHTLEMTVHSKDRYQIAHLLENGHALRNGGRVEGIPHIAPAEEHGEEMLTRLIEKELS